MRRARPVPTQTQETPSPVPDESGEGQALALEAARLGLEKKAEEPVVLDVRGLTSYVDYFVVLSGTNERQVVAITDALVDGLKKQGHRPLGVEGTERGHWVLIDLGDVLVHVMHEEARGFYDLEGLWADARRVEVPGAPPPRAF